MCYTKNIFHVLCYNCYTKKLSNNRQRSQKTANGHKESANGHNKPPTVLRKPLTVWSLLINNNCVCLSQVIISFMINLFIVTPYYSSVICQNESLSVNICMFHCVKQAFGPEEAYITPSYTNAGVDYREIQKACFEVSECYSTTPPPVTSISVQVA